jgi:hypothetical protein
MIRPHLLAWQWSDYAAKHGNRTNLLLHVPAVALFWVGTIVFVCGVTRRSLGEIALAVGCLIVSVAVQGRGHRLEREAPTPFSGAGDFVSRLLVEQWITFPRFLLSGAWSRALGRSGRALMIVGAALLSLQACGSHAVTPTAALPGVQMGEAPWPPELDRLRERLLAIGLPALEAEGTVLHTHQHLDIIVNGRPVPIPAGIGINEAQAFIAPIHTHDTTGILHVESDEVRSFTLGQVFDIWGVRFTASCLGAYCVDEGHTLRIFVNGLDMPGDPRSIELERHQEIAIVYAEKGARVTVPSSYRFPKDF